MRNKTYFLLLLSSFTHPDQVLNNIKHTHTEMTSWFNGYSKLFIKANVLKDSLPQLEATQRRILREKPPKHPLHQTLTVIHVADDCAYLSYLKGGEFEVDLRNIYKESCSDITKELKVGSTHYEMMGAKLDCFAVVMEIEEEGYKKLVQDFKSALTIFLCWKLDLTYREELIDGQYMYRMFSNNESADLIKIPFSDLSPVCHVTLINSSDFERCNKPLFKKYRASQDRFAFLSLECGPITEIITTKSFSLDPLIIVSSRNT